jgi:hypothetical protein
MTQVYVVFSPLFGVGLKGIDELKLGPARIFRNPAAERLASEEQRELPNIPMPDGAAITDAPAALQEDLRRFGLAKYLLEVEVAAPDGEPGEDRLSEEMKWAVLPLRIVTRSRALVGVSPHCQGGHVVAAPASSGLPEKVRREGILAPAPVPYGSSIMSNVTAEAAEAVGEFALTVHKHREALGSQLAHAIDAFSTSFYLPTYTQRGIEQLVALEALFKEAGRKGGVPVIIARRAALFIGKGARRGRQALIKDAFAVREDIERGKGSRGTATEGFFSLNLDRLEDAVRASLFRVVCLLEQGEGLADRLDGLRPWQKGQGRRRSS